MLYTITIIFGTTFAVLHTLAEAFSLYWQYAWLDMPMHVLGGVVLMLMVASLRQMSSSLQRLPAIATPIIFSSALIGWELFGIVRYGGLKPDFWTDTVGDLICGVLGVSLGFILVKSLAQFKKLVA